MSAEHDLHKQIVRAHAAALTESGIPCYIENGVIHLGQNATAAMAILNEMKPIELPSPRSAATEQHLLED